MTSRRQVLVGKLVRRSDSRTIVVQVDRRFSHKKYKKVIRVSKRYHVDVPVDFNLSVGESVEIVSSRPLSKTKRWVLSGSLTEK